MYFATRYINLLKPVCQIASATSSETALHKLFHAVSNRKKWKAALTDSIRYSIRIRILTDDSIRDLIRAKICDSQGPTFLVHFLPPMP